MASQWFYRVMGKQVGPISGAELRTLAQRGAISADTPVRKAPDGAWAPADRVKGLFAAPPIPKNRALPKPTGATNELHDSAEVLWCLDCGPPKPFDLGLLPGGIR